MGASYMSDGESERLTATGTAYAGPTRVRYLHWLESATTAGTITIRDGGASGEVKAVIDTAGNGATGSASLGDVPLRCATDVHVTFDQAQAVTVFYS